MKKKLMAATLALSLLGGASTAVAASAVDTGARPSSATAERVTATARLAPERGIVGLRTVRQCTFRGNPTTCLIDVNRLRVSDNNRRVIAIGTVTPRFVPDAPSFAFHARVLGVDTAPGPFLTSIQQFPSCDIVSLVLGALHLDVLGLKIDLNRVVLHIVGQTGPGNLLGNLLCGLVGLLDGGLVIPRFLAVLNNLLEAINALLRL